MNAYRQGELVFIPVTLTDDEKTGCIKEKLSTPVIREGEATGHKHEIRGKGSLATLDPSGIWRVVDKPNTALLSNEDTHFVLTAENDIKVVHPEHEPLSLPKGEYLIRIQREYDEVKNRSVVD